MGPPEPWHLASRTTYEYHAQRDFVHVSQDINRSFFDGGVPNISHALTHHDREDNVLVFFICCVPESQGVPGFFELERQNTSFSPEDRFPLLLKADHMGRM
jgi:hypothetical protein